MINWHLEPRSKRLITKLQDRIERAERISIPRDYYVFVGKDRAAQRTLAALEARRTRAVERAAGGRFSDLNAVGRGGEYLAADDLAPVVYEVLA